MNGFAIFCAVLAFVTGAVIAWVVTRASAQRARAEAAAASLQAASQLQIELSSLKERASRVPDLEGRFEAASQSLNAANERKAALESEVLRLPPIDAARVQALEDLEAAARQTASLREQVSKLVAELTADRDALRALREDLRDTKSQLAAKVDEAASQAVILGELRNTLQSERGNAEEKLNLLLEAKEVLANQFKSLANDILEEKSKRFTEQNRTNLGALLDPLKTKITEFQSKIEDTYVKEGQERSALGVELKHLKELNQQLSEDAKNLTRALKGSAKAQGTWGEWILEKVLEGSGLRRDHEYVVQSSHTREDGSRALPDVIIHLPEGRSLVIDSKVSLVAYEEFAVTENAAERAAAGKRHMDSIKGHIKGLSDKNYQSLYSLNSLDFVLLFVPIEPAFMLAVASDRDLFMDAWNRNVLLVSPSTLLFVVRTVAHLWRQGRSRATRRRSRSAEPSSTKNLWESSRT